MTPLEHGPTLARLHKGLSSAAAIGSAQLLAAAVGMLRGQTRNAARALAADDEDLVRTYVRQMLTVVALLGEYDDVSSADAGRGTALAVYTTATAWIAPKVSLAALAADRGDMATVRWALDRIHWIGVRTDRATRRAMVRALDGLPTRGADV